MALVVTAENVKAVQDILVREPVLAIDTETTGLLWTDRPFLAIIATGSEEYLFDLPQWGDSLNYILRGTQTLVFQNAKFDLRMLASYGVAPAGAATIHDTEVMARILKNDHMKYNLESQAMRHGFKKLADEVKKALKAGDHYEIRTNRLGEQHRQPRYDWVDRELMHKYAAQDARITYDLHQTYLDQMDEYDMYVLANESRLTRVCFWMEWRGIRLDMDYARKARCSAKLELRRAQARFQAAAGVEFQDSKALLIPIFEAAGDKITYTKKGNPQLRDEDLARFSSPVAEIVRDIREQQKLISTYYDNFINKADEQEKDFYVIHPDMRQAGTRTGRFSYRDPNLQNLPKEEESTAPYVVRGCFIPRPGCVFVSMDYSQQEYRLMLAYARERELIARVMAGEDLHQATADLVGIKRKLAKTLNFAILYGAGPKKLAQMLKISLTEAEELRRKYFEKLPRVQQFIEQVSGTAKARGFIWNWMGRKLQFAWRFALDEETDEKIRYHDAYSAPNHLCQGGGADVIKKAMVELERCGLITLECFPVLQVHDQLVFDCRPSSFHLLHQIAKVLEDAFPEKNGMKLKVDVSWSERSLAERDLQKGYPCLESLKSTGTK